MSHDQGPRTIFAAVAGGIAFVALVAIVSLLGLEMSPLVLIAVLVAVAVMAFLTWRSRMPEARHAGGIASAGIPSAAGAASGAVHSDGASPRRDTPDDGDRTDGAAADAAVAPAEGADEALPVETGSEAEEIAAAPEAPAREAADEANAISVPRVRKGTLLAGEQELAARRGTWRYEKRDTPAEALPDAAVEAKAAWPAEPVEVNTIQTDEDENASDEARGDDAGMTATQEDPAHGVIGTEPVRLHEPREGQADDLRRIKGVGPKLEGLLHHLGIFHFDQIAGWTEQEAAWIDEHLEGFRGRVLRDDWIAQARRLGDAPDPQPEQPAG